eukprot:gene565-1975_t
MASQFSADRVAELKEAFQLFSKSGDGSILAKDLGTVMRAVGKSPTEAQIKTIVAEIDPEGRGSLDFNEFLVAMGKDIPMFDSEKDLVAAWKVFDSDNKGFVTTSQLRHVLASIGEKLSPEELEDLCKESDPNNTGKIERDEFIRMMQAK